MTWGGANRPITSNKLSIPNESEGVDGDIQLRQTQLGAKLFGKVGGRWYDAPLAINGVTKIGTNLSDYLSIDRDSVDIYANNVKVASFGETTTVKDINLTGKIIITSAGTRNIAIGTGNQDVSGMEDNISIGVSAGNQLESGATQNIAIGTQALYTNETGDFNICIGYSAGLLYTGGGLTAIGTGAGIQATGIQNTCLGTYAGDAISAGTSNTCVGYSADCAAASVNRTVIGYNADGQANNSVTLGNSDVTAVYMAEDSGATVHCTSVTIKETTEPSALADHGKIYTKNDNKLYFQDGAGSEHEISFA